MLDLKLAVPASLTELAVDRLREAIVAGHFRPGERLVETRISASFGISRAPLREALRVLASDGLVQIRQNRGAYVVSPGREELEAMVLARALAEGTAGRLLTARRDAGAINELEAVLAEQAAAQAAHDNRGLIDRHWQFHRTICESSGNQFLLDMWSKASAIIRMYSSATIYKVAVANNRVFLDALRGKDPGRSEELLRSQIIIMSYSLLGRRIPDAIRDYVTLYIDLDDTVLNVHGPDAGKLDAILERVSAEGSSDDTGRTSGRGPPSFEP